VEEPLDAESIDAMLNAFASSDSGEPPPQSTPAAAKPPTLSQQEIEEALAREELEGLADLFESPSEAGAGKS
jgi:hypothetical protein